MARLSGKHKTYHFEGGIGLVCGGCVVVCFGFVWYVSVRCGIGLVCWSVIPVSCVFCGMCAVFRERIALQMLKALCELGSVASSRPLGRFWPFHCMVDSENVAQR